MIIVFNQQHHFVGRLKQTFISLVGSIIYILNLQSILPTKQNENLCKLETIE